MNKQCFEFNKLCEEAQLRWLKPPEVLYILQNHEKYPIASKAFDKPPSGSLFLFNKRVLRYFRKDGHNWRKKKNGKNVGEAHERLKVGNSDALNCYYAHGEQNPFFQRRSYWMLEPAYEHIVLVHYREVLEGRFLNGSNPNISIDTNSTHSESICATNTHYQVLSNEQHEVNLSSPGTVEEVNSESALSNFNLSQNNASISYNQSPSDVSLALRKLEMQLSLQDADDENGANYFAQNLPMFPGKNNSSQDFGFLDNRNVEFTQESHGYHLSGDGFRENQNGHSSKPLFTVSGANNGTTQPSWNHEKSSSSYSLLHANTSTFSAPVPVLESSDANHTAYERTQERGQFDWSCFNHGQHSRYNIYSKYPILESNSIQLEAAKEYMLGPENPPSSVSQHPKAQIPNFSRQNSTDWMTLIDVDVLNNPSDLLFDQKHCDIPPGDDSCLFVAANKMFSIREISPEWSFLSENTKVIIIGDFLCNSSDYSWAIMFGEIAVPAKIIQEGVLCCIAPQLTVGKVPLCVACGNHAPCSELKIFEYRAKPTNCTVNSYSDEFLMQIKLARLLLCNSSEDCSLEWILQELLKEKLTQWLLSKSKGDDLLLSKQEQGIIHIISRLGYEWALNPILNSGIGVNFRDPKGWTALHWAARFGRENMVAALLAAGASPEAVTDATQNDPVGKTAGAIAAAYGHTGLAGYLSEASLTSHLFQLTIAVSKNSNNLTELESQGAVESISQRSNQIHVGGTEDELSLKDSLAAVRNATQAAARIQEAFRAHSFRRRQMMNAAQDKYGVNASHGNHAENMEKAALSIQKKYRGWKGRKEFLTLRKNTIKIQAHFRGYQERKKYKVILWSVSMLDKAVLRWRRRSAGLRGYKAKTETGLNTDTDEDIYDIVKAFRKLKVDAAVDQAVIRVLHVVNSPTARQQYRRMLGRFLQAQVEASTSDEAMSYESISKLIDDFDDSEFLDSLDLLL